MKPLRKTSLLSLLLALCLSAWALTPGARAAGGPLLVTGSAQSSSQSVGFDRLSPDCRSLQATFVLSSDTPCLVTEDSGLAGRPGIYTTYQQSGRTVTVYVTAKSGTLTDTGALTLGTLSAADGATPFTVEQAAGLKLLGIDYGETSYDSLGQAGDSSSGGVTTWPVTVADTQNGTVTASVLRAARGARVTLTAVPQAGYVLQSLSVADASGSRVSLTHQGDGKYVFTMPASAVTVTAVFAAQAAQPQLPFTDVPAGSWYYDGVAYAYHSGLMNGTGADRFSPQLTTSRAMIVTILYRMEGSPAVSGGAAFTDVSAGQWYSDGVAWAGANGIVTGYTGGAFGPSDPITREQLAAILFRYARYKGYDVSAQAQLSGYSDAGQVAAYAAESMRWAVGSGLITGTSAATLSPAGSATRAQAAVILARFCQSLEA